MNHAAHIYKETISTQNIYYTFYNSAS